MQNPCGFKGPSRSSSVLVRTMVDKRVHDIYDYGRIVTSIGSSISN